MSNMAIVSGLCAHRVGSSAIADASSAIAGRADRRHARPLGALAAHMTATYFFGPFYGAVPVVMIYAIPMLAPVVMPMIEGTFASTGPRDPEMVGG